MTPRLYISLAVSAVVLAGCVQTQEQASQFTTIPGANVRAGIPCGHVAEDRRASVPGCQTLVTSVGPEMSRDELIDLNTRFREEVQVVVNFDFDRDELRPDARAILDAQANWIKQYPDLRFSVFGHTDLVGSLDYNFDLARRRRADAAVAYLLSHGIDETQLEAVVSFGKTQPLIDTPNREERNRRTVTEVTGYLRLAGRTAIPIPCSWLDAAYLPTYGQCISGDPRVPPVPPVPPTTPQPPIQADYSSPNASGSASITFNPDGSITREAEGITGPANDPRTETAASSTEEADQSVGNLSATVTDSRGNVISASQTNNPDGTTTYQGGTQSVTN